MRIAHAGVEAASSTAPELLNAASLGPDAFAHEKSSQAKRLAAMWDEAARQVSFGTVRGVWRRCSQPSTNAYPGQGFRSNCGQVCRLCVSSQ